MWKSFFDLQSWPFINKSFLTFTLLSIKKDKQKIVHIIPTPNCLQFDTIRMILEKRVKSQGVSEEEHDSMIYTPTK